MTPSVFPLLRLLSDGQFHPSEDIARELGISGGRLSDELDTLAMSGLEIERDRSAGRHVLDGDIDQFIQAYLLAGGE